MKFPQTIKHRKAEVTIYGRKPGYPFYRISWRFGGQRHMQSFPSYGAAKAAAQERAKKLSNGEQILALRPREIDEAVSIRSMLENYRRDTGRDISALEAVSKFLSADQLLQGRSITEAVEGYLSTVAVVKPVKLERAVDEFLAEREPKTRAPEGKRPALDPKYFSNVSRWLMELSSTFQGHLMSDLTKSHIDLFMNDPARTKLSTKSRNDRRAAFRMFLKWCVRADYLSPSHRLLEAEGFRLERNDPAPAECYTAAEFRSLLEGASGPLRAVIAIQGLAGARLDEVLRLDWRDISFDSRTIQVASAKAKTRQRRVVDMVPALVSWLQPYRDAKGPVAGNLSTLHVYMDAFIKLRNSLNIPSRKNGLRHAFASAHLTIHKNESQTAATIGNTAEMVHRHYKSLMTKSAAEKWFDVTPSEPANVILFAKNEN